MKSKREVDPPLCLGRAYTWVHVMLCYASNAVVRKEKYSKSDAL